MHAGEFERGAGEFERALEIDSGAALVHANLAIAMMNLRRWEHAEASARRALRLDPSNHAARYILGSLSLARGECTPQAVEDLRAAAERYQAARIALERALACRDANDKAGGWIK
ncbi:MAG: tetratricopeptide repeat protein [Bryobacteraceae bacterium]